MNKRLTQEEIKYIHTVCKQYKIENYTINPDGSINVDQYVNLDNRDFYKLPLKFTSVRGDFSCSNNNLTSLEGCPTYVGGSFYCFNNQLTSLEGCTSSVGNFDCSNNNLTSLKFSPTLVGGYFYCSFNRLLPSHFRHLYNRLCIEEEVIFIKYQHDLRIWEDVYNEEDAQILYEEIIDGML